MFWLLGWVVFGFFAGLVARALVPGQQQLGFFRTTGLGIAGSFAGGLVVSLVTHGGIFGLHASGFIGAVIGSCVLLLLFGRRRGLR